MSGPTKPVARTSPDFERYAKQAGAFVLALYVLGLLAINGFLFSVGASDFSLVRPRFVYTGSLIALCAVVCLLLPLYLLEVATRVRRGNPTEDYSVFLQVFLVAIGLIAPVLFLAVLVRAVDPRLALDALLKSVVAVYVTALFCGFVCERLIRALLKEKDRWGRLKAGRLAVVTTLVIAALAIFVTVFMSQLFQVIPHQFGGGRPIKATLLIKHDEAQGVRTLGVPIESNAVRVDASGQSQGSVTHLLEVMYEGSEAYLIRLDNRTLVRLDKDLVLAVKVSR
jgi:hypothetical protein